MSDVDNEVLEAVRVPSGENVDLASDMTTAYMGYARATITDRALPDVRDGLKPVQRRILYAMHGLRLDSGHPHRKAARIVGEVLGKYHPHGDASVYHALVRMAQDFAMALPLVDGQGNFGSIDGDRPAAMRYTEARLTAAAEAMLRDLKMDTVGWVDNFDGSLQEPLVLSTVLPNLLVNGSSGIAVGMATNMPPHNLGEVCDAVAYVAEKWEDRDQITTDDLLAFLPGPDFPTGGILYRYRDDDGNGSRDTLRQAYETGRGRVVTQARVTVEEIAGGKSNLVVTELPYGVQKNTVVEKIAREVHRGRVTGVTDLRDESDYTGMRLVIEVSRQADPQEVLSQVLKYSQLRETFGVINLALVPTEDGEPRPEYLTLLDLLVHFVAHRLEVIERRSRFELAEREARLHIVEGLLNALDVLDEVIETIRRSQEPRTARANLMKKFAFTEAQADAILRVELRQLAALGRTQLKREGKELRARIEFLEGLLASQARRLKVVVEETRGLRERFAIPRRTVIVDDEEQAAGTVVMTGSDLVAPEGVQVVVLTPEGVERVDAVGFSYRVSDGVTTRSARNVHLAQVRAEPDDEVILVTNHGRGWKGEVGFIPAGGTPKELGLEHGEGVIGVGVRRPGDYLLLGTQGGKVKRTAVADLALLDRQWGPVVGLSQDDELLFGGVAGEGAHVLFYTAEGRLLRLDGDAINPQVTATASGVVGISVGQGDRLLGGTVVPSAAAEEDAWQVVVVSQNGYAHRVPLAEFSVQGRGSQGIRCLRQTKSGGSVGDVAVGGLGATVDVYLDDGRRCHVPELEKIGATSRAARGKRLVQTDGAEVVRVVTLS